MGLPQALLVKTQHSGSWVYERSKLPLQNASPNWLVYSLGSLRGYFLLVFSPALGYSSSTHQVYGPWIARLNLGTSQKGKWWHKCCKSMWLPAKGFDSVVRSAVSASVLFSISHLRGLRCPWSTLTWKRLQSWNWIPSKEMGRLCLVNCHCHR